MLNIPAALGGLARTIPAPLPGRQRPTRSLAGSVVVITGGAAGIGRATAQALAELGAVVAIGDIDGEAAERAAVEVGAVAGRRLDVTDRDAFTAFLDDVEADIGPIDVLINNAGVMPLGRIVEEDDSTTERIIAINLHAVIHGTREAARRMLPRGGGHIINIASTAGKAGLPGGATYCATKFGVVGFSESVRAELEDGGIAVTVVLPGIVQTSLGEGLTQPRFIRRVVAEDVARQIADALLRPRYELYVPFEVGPLSMLGAALPHALRDRVARSLGLHDTLVQVDAGARAEYEARVRPAAAAV